MLKLFSHILNTSNAEWKRFAVGILILFFCMWLLYIAKSFVYPELFFRFVVQNLDLWTGFRNTFAKRYIHETHSQAVYENKCVSIIHFPFAFVIRRQVGFAMCWNDCNDP